MPLLDLPPIFLLPAHLEPDELHDLEDRVPSVTYDVREAEVVVGNISKRERALFELRRAKLATVPLDTGLLAGSIPPPPTAMTTTMAISSSPSSPRKRRRISGSEGSHVSYQGGNGQGHVERTATHEGPGIVRVVKLSWLTESLQRNEILPLDEYLLYEGRKVTPEPGGKQPQRVTGPSTMVTKISGADILRRAAEDSSSQPSLPHKDRGFGGHARSHSPSLHGPPPPLLHHTTSEHNEPLPPLPAFLNTTYSCQRPTPVDPPNGAFVEELKKVRTLRLLQGDQVGVRAYSTSIATLAAYPRALQGPHDVARLPGCGSKIAVLYQQWLDTGQLSEVVNASTDPQLTVLQLFYDIWGVGDTTARAFYKKGWRDLDDLVEYAWSSLSRVQQIGVKYYDEFLLKIPRQEVEAIANAILAHARRVDPGFQMVIVGGYRRGKQQSGDVDVVLSHPDEERTLNLVETLVMSLEKERLITHTLTMSTRNSERGQMPLAWKGEGRKGSGFDTLDKALVVWQSPGPTSTTVGGGGGGSGSSSSSSSAASEPSSQHVPSRPHRRVDIIVSPWKTAGCAVLGWSGGTTFQRDLRRYCKKEKGLKFDSSGIRSRADGTWVDLEGAAVSASASGGELGPAWDMETAERRVFEGLGLTYRRPEERCTG